MCGTIFKLLFCGRIRTSGSFSSEENGTPYTSERPDTSTARRSERPQKKEKSEEKQSEETVHSQPRRTRKEGQFRNPDHSFLAKPAVIVYTSLTPELGRRIPVNDENAVMVHFVFDREVERRVHLAYTSEKDNKKDETSTH